MSVEDALAVQDLRSTWCRMRNILSEHTRLRRFALHVRHVLCTREVTMWHRCGFFFLASAIIGCGGETEPETDGGCRYRRDGGFGGQRRLSGNRRFCGHGRVCGHGRWRNLCDCLR